MPHAWERWTLKTRRLPGWWPRVVASPVPWQVRARGSRHTGGRPVRTLSTLPRDPTARHLHKRETSSVCKCPQLETAPGSCHEGQTGNHPLDGSRLGVERNQLLPQAQVSPDPLRRHRGQSQTAVHCVSPLPGTLQNTTMGTEGRLVAARGGPWAGDHGDSMEESWGDGTALYRGCPGHMTDDLSHLCSSVST